MLRGDARTDDGQTYEQEDGHATPGRHLPSVNLTRGLDFCRMLCVQVDEVRFGGVLNVSRKSAPAPAQRTRMATPPPTGVPSTVPDAVKNGPTFLGHPRGLFLLFLVEMWERFSYYGMRALLVLYLVRAVTGDDKGFNPGRGWSEADASTLYGWYTGLAYLFPIFGGMIADKLIGTHRSMLVGGVLITIGHIILGVSGFGALANNAAGMSLFIAGLAVIVLGTGHFKPTVSVMVGQLYEQKDPRRDGAFTIFYMGINLGAFLCAFVCGTLGEKVGWHWGFGSAAVGMILGLLLYMWGKPRFLPGIGEQPASTSPAKATSIGWMCLLVALGLSALVGLAYSSGVFGKIGEAIASLQKNPALGWTIVGVMIAGILGWVVWFLGQNRPEDRGPVLSIFIFMFFNAFFWIAFEQAGSSINVFTEQSTDRHLAGPSSFEVPATWFQSINAALIFAFAPVFAMIWTKLGKRNMNPSQPVKIALGLIFLGLGFLFMTWAGVDAKGGAKAAMWLVFMTYFWHTMGELCLSPTGLSYVTKTAPAKFVSLLMGIWFVSSFIANLGGGLIAAKVTDIETGKLKLPWDFGGRADFFFLFVVSSIGAGVVILVLTPLLKKLMRPGVE
jgi:proton-dependent oligopeptide transporter, POT family